MSRRKRQPEQFDVLEFLRESDGDLKSALNSLLGSPSSAPAEANERPNKGPGIKLRPGVGDTATLSGQPEYSSHHLEVNSGPGINLLPGTNLIPGSNLIPD